MFAKTLGFAVEYLSSSYWHALSKNLKESEENKDQKLQYHLDNRLAFILCCSIVASSPGLLDTKETAEVTRFRIQSCELPQISYQELLNATYCLSSQNLIGSGSFGSFYKGTLGSDGKVVAVKVLNLRRSGAARSFLAECQALKSVRHYNRAKVITACSSNDFHGNDFKALVYQFISNGSLDKWVNPQ